MELVPANGLTYSILDPTGNITALVESRVEESVQPQVASYIMNLQPEVEQVGFVQWDAQARVSQASLRMAGGEFCGNATMSAAFLYCISSRSSFDDRTVFLKVSGTDKPVEVRLSNVSEDSTDAVIHMPCALSITSHDCTYEGLVGPLPLVRMQGISHLVIEPSSVFFALKDNDDAARAAVRSWCTALCVDGLGLMFLEPHEHAYKLTPLVYVPVADTIYWESSCASGSSAVGMYLASATGKPCDLQLIEPGGTLRVTSDPYTYTTWLHGHVRFLSTHLADWG